MARAGDTHTHDLNWFTPHDGVLETRVQYSFMRHTLKYVMCVRTQLLSMCVCCNRRMPRVKVIDTSATGRIEAEVKFNFNGYFVSAFQAYWLACCMRNQVAVCDFLAPYLTFAQVNSLLAFGQSICVCVFFGRYSMQYRFKVL